MKKIISLFKITFLFLFVLLLIGCNTSEKPEPNDPDKGSEDPKNETVEVTSVTITGKKTEALVGEEFTVSATVEPSDATDKTVIWASSDPTVAAVNNGKVTALKKGTTEISAKAGEKTDKFTLTVDEEEIVIKLSCDDEIY